MIGKAIFNAAVLDMAFLYAAKQKQSRSKKK